LRDWTEADGLLWVHLERDAPESIEYLSSTSGIDPIAADALLATETRPRAVSVGNALLLLLRGVNLNPGADPEDMVSLRIWAEPKRIITTRHRPVMAINDMRLRFERGRGPTAIGDIVVQIASGLVDRMAFVLAALDEAEDDLEELLIDSTPLEARSALARIRRQAIALRRYLAPQRDALNRVQTEELDWLTSRQRSQLREVADRVVRYVEDLDAIRERAGVIQDELMTRLSDKMNRNMYLLTIVASVMLPLGFLTGLLGINVDGIPGSQDMPTAFLWVCGGLGVIVLAEVWLFRKLGWF
jgi:zinc transporter